MYVLKKNHLFNRGFESRSDQAKDYKRGILFFFTQNTQILLLKSKMATTPLRTVSSNCCNDIQFLIW